jgi:hypothetical protein
MEIELTTPKHPSDQRYRYGESSFTSTLSGGENALHDKTIPKESGTTVNISKSGYSLFVTIKLYPSSLQLFFFINRGWFSQSRKMNVFATALFISLSITVGVLTICLTAPKSSMFEFKVDCLFQKYLFLKQ